MAAVRFPAFAAKAATAFVLLALGVLKPAGVCADDLFPGSGSAMSSSFAVSVDTVVAAAAAAAAWPADGAYTNNRRPNFLWIGPSTDTVTALGGAVSFDIQIANDSGFSSLLASSSAISGVFSTGLPTADAAYSAAADLPEGVTVYWRVRVRNPATDLTGSWSSARTLVTDYTVPSASGFVSVSSAGYGVAETGWLGGVMAGATAQATVGDTVSGLAVSTSALAFAGDGHDNPGLAGGLGVAYSTNAGASWIDGVWTASNGGVTVGGASANIYSLSAYGGSLYAAIVGNAKVAYFNGSAWQLSASDAFPGGGETSITASAVYKGRLYVAGGTTGRVASFDGAAWADTNANAQVIAGESNVYSLAVLGDRLYAGGYNTGKVAMFDGSVWYALNGGNPPVASANVQSLAVYNGRLYAGLYASGAAKAAVFDGMSWSSANGGAAVLSSPATTVSAMAVYNGKLYAGGTGAASAAVYDGSAWTEAALPSGMGNLLAFAVHGGRLYASFSAGKAAYYDGVSWKASNGGAALISGQTQAKALASFGGKLYAGLDGGMIAELAPLQASFPAGTTDGALTPKIVSSPPLAVASSTNSATCGGTYPCGATNQVQFNAADMAGNVRSFGPYTVRRDSTTPSLSITAADNGLDITVSASVSDSGGSGAGLYRYELSPDSGFATDVSSTQWVTSGSQTFRGLLDATTYYARAWVQDQAGNASAESVAVSTATRGLVYAAWVSTASSSAMQLSTSAMLYATFHLGGHPTVPASLSRINVTLTSTGTLRAADVANVNIYRDNNNNGVLDAGDPMIGSQVVGGASPVAVNLTSPLIVPTDGSSKSVFVVYEFAADAVVGHTLGARINSPADLVVNDPFSVTDATFPFVSSQTTVLDGPNLLNVSISDASPGSVQPGQSNVSVLKLQMQTNTGSSILQSLTLHIDGTAAFSDLANVNVYEDANQSGAWDAGDTLIGNGTFAAADSAINFTSPQAARTVGSDAPSYYFVTVDISAGASLGGYFRLSVSTPSALALVTAPEDAVVLSAYPAYSGDVYIQSQSTATITLSAIPHSEFYQGGLYMVALASCSVDTGKAYLHTIQVNRTGSSADADVSDVRVYQKGFADGSVNLSSYDTLIGSAAFSGNTTTVHIATVTLQYPNPKQLLIAYNVAPSANPGGLLGLGITNHDYFIMSSSYVTVNMTPSPFTVTAAQVKQTSNPFRIVSFLDMTGGSLMQGTTNNAMLKLTVRSELNPVMWTSLTLHGTGSGILPPHNYVTHVKLYKDDGSGFHPSTATLVTSGSDVFDSAGNVTLALDQQVYAPASYYVAFDMHVDAQVGYDAGVEITTTSWFSVNSPSFISTNSLSAPYSAGPVDITQYANTVTISTSSLVPGQGAYPGATDVGVMQLTLNTDVSKANFLSIKINRGGTSSDSDVSAVKVYYDANSYGDFLHPITQYQLVTPSTVTFNTDGVAYSATLGIAATGSAQQLTPTPVNYFVAVDIAPGATVGRTVVLRSLDKNYFTVSVPNRVADGSSFTSPALLIRTPPQTVSSYFESKIATTVLQGQTAVLVSSFTLAASSYTVSFTSLQAQRAGNGADSDVTKLSLYRDSGNGTWGGAGEDVFVASAAFSGQIAAFTLPSETITWPAPNLYYIVADMSQTAKYGKYFGISVSNPAWLTFNEPHEADAVNTSIPFASTQALISAVVNTLVVDSHNSAVLARQCDANKALGWFDMHTDNNAVQLNSVRFTASGTASESEVYNIRLYKDNGDNTFTFDDQLVTQSSNAFSGGQLSLQLPTAQTITTASQRYFVTADISCTAAWGATFGMTVSSAAISVSEPNIVSVTGSTAAFSMDSGGIRHLPSTVYMRFADQGLQSLYVGKTDTLLARLDFWNDRDKAYLGAIKLKVSDVTPGGLSAADLAAVKIYRDSDGNGAFSLADDALLGSAAVDAGQVEFSLPSSGDLITPATRSYFIAVDVGAGAAIGNTVNLSMTDSSYLSLLSSSLGTDNMAAFVRQATTDAGIRDLRTPTPPAVALYKANGLSFGASETNYNANRTRLSYSWNSQAYQGSVGQSYYRLDTRPSVASDTGWTDAGLDSRIVIADLDLANGATYYLAIRTKNALGAWYSDVTNIPFMADLVVPYFNTADKDLPAPSRETGVMIMTWNQAQTGVSGLDYYQVQEQPSSTPLWTTVSTTAARTLMISNSGITAQNYAAQKMSFAGGAKGAAAAQLVRAPGVYSYRIVPVNRAGVAGTPTNSLRTEVNLSALAAIADASAYPNPFDSRKEGVTIYFASNQSDAATVTIYDMWGRKVTSLSDGAANPHRIPWDGADGGGRKVSKGVYLAVIKSGGTQTVVKIAVIH